MKRAQSWDSKVGDSMATPQMVPDPISAPPRHLGSPALPSYLTFSCSASGFLTGTFLILLVLGIMGRTAFGLTVWVWLTLFFGAAGVFSTSMLRIRDLRAHAV